METRGDLTLNLSFIHINPSDKVLFPYQEIIF